MTRSLFGTDGIRGVANQGAVLPEIAFRVGAALVHQVRNDRSRNLPSSHVPRVVVGKDTRLSGYMLETALVSGVCAMGGRALLSGPLPTPAIAHLTTSMRADAGVVISASHNSFEDNGIKIFGHDGFKLPDASESAIEALIAGETLDKNRPIGADVGTADRLDDAAGRYIAFAKHSFPNDLTLEGLRIVVDAAHGAAYRVAPTIFAELGAKVTTIGTQPDGKNINLECGAVHPQACAREVKRVHADIGLALDGDADRLIVIDEKGQEVDGDVVMALCAKQLLLEKRLPKKTLVATVMSNLGLERAMEEAGGRLVRTAVGDRYVVEEMRRHGFALGGEQSGHMVFMEHATTGDGTIAALQMLALLRRSGKPLSQLAKTAMTKVPQVLVNAVLPIRRPLSEMPKTQKAMAHAEKALGKKGRVLVRWSGTEAKLRVMIEGEKEAQIRELAERIANEARADLGTKDS